jgi:hypothetical protein
MACHPLIVGHPSTRNPPHEQWLIRLEQVVVSFVGKGNWYAMPYCCGAIVFQHWHLSISCLLEVTWLSFCNIFFNYVPNHLQNKL